MWYPKSSGPQSRLAPLIRCFYCIAAGLLSAPVWAGNPIEGAKDTHLKSARMVADLLDAQMQVDWRNANVVPTPVTDDSEFLRRVFLHLNGTIPDVFTARHFLADNSPQKRQQQIDQCLDGAAYCTNFALVFRDVLLPDPGGNYFARQAANGFEVWLTQQFALETRYDQIVLQIVAGDSTPNGQTQQVYSTAIQPSQINPSAFYSSRQAAPENLAAATTRHFLGVRIECAQCHNHPFDHWTQEQFWAIAAFFSGQPTKTKAGDVTFRIKIPNTENYVSAAFLEDSPAGWTAGTDSRKTIAKWVTAPTNRRFSQAAVNRIWGHLFGRGLVDPVDDFYDGIPASHPEVLDLLADEFVAHDYDLKFLLRAITYSQTYQLSSRHTDPSQDAPDMFARMQAQGLTASQLLNSVTQAGGIKPDRQQQFATGSGIVDTSTLSFVSLFPNSDGSSLERESSILQSLLLMNGDLISQSVSRHRSGMLTAILDTPFLDLDQKIDTLFLATLTRFPTEQERERVHQFLETPVSRSTPVPLVKLTMVDRNRGLSELLWALLNSSEFCLNH